jgi:hypothetical protein
VDLAASSTEFLHIAVTGPDGVTVTDTAPEVAVIAGAGNPATSDWVAGEWTDGTTARLLVGPDGGAVTLTPGDYKVWLKVVGGAETVVRRSGILSII